MRIIRFQVGKEPPSFGWLMDNAVGALEGSPFGEFRRLETTHTLEEVHLLAPVQPGKVIGIGRNYVAHAKEHAAEVPEVPLMFLKPSTAVIGTGADIVLPPQSQRVEHEAELVVVIGKRGRWITTEQALDHVLGYTCGNDVTARDLQFGDGQWTRGKGFDTFCVLGPWIETDFDPADAVVSCHVNGEMRQMASTRDMVFSVRQLVAFASSVMTLEPGDVIMTGTPSGVSPIVAGDVVEVAVEGLGSLKNLVVEEQGH